MPNTPNHPYSNIPPFDKKTGDLNVIIDTPKGSRNKYELDPDLGIFKLGGVLPAGAAFPFNFGFVPNTRGGDNDPIDVLVIVDEPAFVGCLVRARPIGIIEANQTERDGTQSRNDRIIAVASTSRDHLDIKSLSDLNGNLLDEIEHFFVSYNEIKGKEFKPLARSDAAQAVNLVQQGTVS